MNSDLKHAVVRIDGVDLETAYRAPENPGGPTLVFLHEGLGSLSIWRDFPARLAATTGCGVLVYSRFGYGRSTICETGFEPDYMHRQALETLPALLDQFEVSNPVLYGHSDGASISLIHAGGAGRPVRGLIVEAPHVFVEPESLTGLELALDAFENGTLRESLARHHNDADLTFRAWHDVWGSEGFRDWNIEGYLGAITAPVLMIQGADDAYGSLDQLDAIERGLSGPHERAVIAGCGHGPHRELPDQVLGISGGFVRAILSDN
ncbi:MAG: alpha/beta hydrolase [Alphaproteobacteria bacterium]|nr:alpha/beta hydrolase [Alphaproteobacteria bacterium]